MRLLAVLELLEIYSSISGPELARRLEVDRRTVRRYIVTLQDMGIPVASERGPYGSYRLERGSRLPPLIFNDSEASAIILGLMVLRQMRFPMDPTAIEAAYAKTKRLLPEKLLGYVNDLEDLVTVYNPPYIPISQIPHTDFVSLLDHAIKKRKTVEITHVSQDGRVTTREVDLYGLVLIPGHWYTAGYCHLRKDLRTFRLDRLRSVTKTEKVFERPENFDVLNHVLGSIERVQSRFEVEVMLKTSLDHALGCLPSETHYLEPVDGGVLYRQSTSRLDWVAFSLITLDVPIIIRKPQELSEVFRGISEKAGKIAAS
ncbi:helix-turn-helix transcriptional regulator [Spirochaeta lutea]|uniref:HTH deoR-type domain-containing protein n=1 Tax=Spirochaeta lutea TaxID=1480694 RepID=A0A098R022_9SPIO|nr:YafY family protein [Spirochaeta lutea]KGE73294.1 hypothetical protein DC28_04830 [Spirochaeta lutea]